MRAEGGGGGGWTGRVQGVLLQAECDGAGEEGQPEGHQGHQGWVTLTLALAPPPAAVLPWTVSEPLRRRGSRRTRQPSTKRSFRRSRLAAVSRWRQIIQSFRSQAAPHYNWCRRRSVKRGAADSDRERGGPPPPALLPAPSLLHRINLFVTSSEFLLSYTNICTAPQSKHG